MSDPTIPTPDPDLSDRMRAEAARRPGQGGEYAMFAGYVAGIIRPGRYGRWADVPAEDRLAAIGAALAALDEATR